MVTKNLATLVRAQGPAKRLRRSKTLFYYRAQSGLVVQKVSKNAWAYFLHVFVSHNVIKSVNGKRVHALSIFWPGTKRNFFPAVTSPYL